MYRNKTVRVIQEFYTIFIDAIYYIRAGSISKEEALVLIVPLLTATKTVNRRWPPEITTSKSTADNLRVDDLVICDVTDLAAITILTLAGHKLDPRIDTYSQTCLLIAPKPHLVKLKTIFLIN